MEMRITSNTVHPIGASGAGTSLQGYITADYAELVRAFGMPNGEGDGYKVQAEWILSTPAGIATVYDYKMGKDYNGEDGIPAEEVTEWHIGGASKAVVQWVEAALVPKGICAECGGMGPPDDYLCDDCREG
jgi:hypothetical protein